MFVGLRRSMTACGATKFRLRDAILRCCVPTDLAAIGHVPGVDLNPDTPSLFRFGAQNRDEPAPAGVTYASRKPGLRPGTATSRRTRGCHVDGQGTKRRTGLDHVQDSGRRQTAGPSGIRRGACYRHVFRLVAERPAPAGQEYSRPTPTSASSSHAWSGSRLRLRSPMPCIWRR